MARKVVIATHGGMAGGIKDSLKIIAGSEDEIITINGFTEVINPKAVIQELMETTGPDQEMLVFTDIMGGSMNRMFMPYLKTHNIHLITGCNLPLICQLVLTFEEPLKLQSIYEAIDQAKAEIKYVNDEISDSITEGDSEDTFFS